MLIYVGLLRLKTTPKSTVQSDPCEVALRLQCEPRRLGCESISAGIFEFNQAGHALVKPRLGCCHRLAITLAGDLGVGLAGLAAVQIDQGLFDFANRVAYHKLVSHDGADVMAWADELLIMQAGHVVQHGPPRQLYAQPASEYCAAMLGAYSYFPIGPGGSPQLVRPEQLSLSAHEQPGYYPALIEQVFFEGPATLLQLRWQQHTVWARSPLHHWQAGHTVYLAPQVQPIL